MKHIIYSNYNLSDYEDETKKLMQEEYPDLCTVEVVDETGEVSYEPTETDLWDFIYSEDSDAFNEVWEELKKFFTDKTLLFVGKIGRWNGTFAGGKIGEFEKLFNEGMTDCDYIELSDEKGHLYLHGSHHDGNVDYEIKELSDKGYELFDKWSNNYSDERSEQQIHQIIFNNNLFSRLPHFNKKVYGVNE